MLRESTLTSMGRSRARLTVSNTTPTSGAPATSGWAARVMSTDNGSSPRVPLRVIVSPMAWPRITALASSAVEIGVPSMTSKRSPTSITPIAGVSSTTCSTSTPSPTKVTSYPSLSRAT